MRPLGKKPSDGDDFEAFVHATASALLRSAVLLCGDRHLAEDLVQTTYAKTFAHWDRVRSADSPLAYARTVLLRSYLSHRRKRSAHERPVDAVPETATAGGADDVRRLDLLAALAELSPADRAVVVLRYWEDLSVAQAAAVLGLKETTVRARASRALARLRTRFPELEDRP